MGLFEKGAFRLRSVQVLMCLLFLSALVLPLSALADPSFNSDNFKQKWQRADKAIADGVSNPPRSWLWGPEGFSPTTGDTEPYADSPGGRRQIQYFDKARMELNNPATGLVTNGLLVRELISGQLATGDRTSTARQSAFDIPVGGDAVNNDGPTYSSFAQVASLNLDHPATDRTGQPITENINKAGKIGASPELGNQTKYAYFEGTLKHNIPDVFWKFMNQTGNIYENGQYKTAQPVLGSNPAAPWLDATGYALTEPYWAKVTVGGQIKDVLIQTFERRVLTYTPTNPAAYQVEMGNVGRHYFTWRYTAKYDLAPTPPAVTVNSCKDLPADDTDIENFIRCGPAGMQISLFVTGLKANEPVNLLKVAGDGTTSQVTSFTASKNGGLSLDYNTSAKTQLGYQHFRLVGTQSGKNLDYHLWLDPPRTSPTILASRASGDSAEIFAFAILGFNSNEQVNYVIKGPGGREFHTTKSVAVNDSGGLTILVLPVLEFGDNAVPGDWTLTAVSVADGKRYAGIHFTITG